MPPVLHPLLLTLALAFTARAAAPAQPQTLLLRFKEGITPSVENLPLPAGCHLTEPFHAPPPPGGFLRPDYAPTRFHILELPAGSDAAAILAALKGHPALRDAVPDMIGSAGATVPNDPGAPSQWHLTPIRSQTAWDRTQGSTSVILAIMDTGIATSLTDFSGRLLPGYDFINSDSNPNDDNGHGTAVAAIAAATGNNGAGVAGIDWRCRILPVKVLDSNGFGQASKWIPALDYAVQAGADVVNLSAGGDNSDSNGPLTEAIDRAIAAGVIFISITHNDFGGIRYPGSLPQCITVGATRLNGWHAGYSNFGPEIDLVAPGGDPNDGDPGKIVSLNRNGTTGRFTGTSFAAPQVAGTAALIRALRPDIRQAEMEAILCASAIDQSGGPDDTPGFDIFYGYGRLDIPNALTLATARPALELPGPGQVRLSWPAPTNAAAKKPFAIEYSEDAAHWHPLPPVATLIYSTGIVRFTDDGTFTGGPPGRRRFYRSSIRR